jgi:hypothetical protein
MRTRIAVAAMSLVCAGLACADSVLVNDPGFELTGSIDVGGNPSCPGNYCYTSNDNGSINPSFNFPMTSLSSGGWTFEGSAGVTGPGTAFGPPVFLPGSSYAALLQGPFTSDPAGYGFGNEATVSQSIGFDSAGAYEVSFYLGGRSNGSGAQTVNVFVGNVLIGSETTTTGQAFTLYTLPFTIAAPSAETLEFAGGTNGDNTAFLDNVSVSSSTPEPSTIGLVGLGSALLACSIRRRVS